MINKLGNIASIIGFILSVLVYFKEDDNSIIIGGIALLFVFLFIATQIQLNYTKHYLSAMNAIQDIHYDVIKNQDYYKKYNLDKSVAELTLVCSQISDMFTKLRRSQISVCIKYTNIEKDVYYVKTLCRDHKSHIERNSLYDNSKLDNINENTDFKVIFEKLRNNYDWKRLYYCENRLPWTFQYNNTHLVIDESFNGLFAFYHRYKKWPLPYKSTIIAPILSDDNKTIYGYLCVDSPKNNGFNKERDIKIMQQIALFLSPIVRTVFEQHLIK